MIRLPRELAPWAPFLEAFPEEDVRTIWPWLPRLNTLLGPVHVDSEKRSGETDGFDGLTRRGIYDRLVSGEWALLELLPDEFIRRAAMNEQLFLKPARRSPQEAKRSVMLFDAGPDQLGGPRLVHLALLMIMARRARTSRTSFAWGILQNPPEMREEFSAEQLARLVGARTWDAPEPGHIDRWEKALASLEPEDLWIVGSPGLAHVSQPHRASTIIVDVPLEAAATHLTVTVARPGNAPHRRVRLELPAQDAGVRLLRASAYRKTAAPPEVTSVSGAIQLSWNGRRLFTRGLDSALIAYHIPNTSKELPGKARELRPGPGEALLAATRDSHRWSWLTLREGRIVGHGPEVQKTGGADAGVTEDGAGGFTFDAVVAAPPDDASVSPLIPWCAVKVGENFRRCVAFTDGRQALVGICDNKIVLYKARVSFCLDNTETHARSLLMMENLPGVPRRLVNSVQGEISDHPLDLTGDGTFEMVKGPSSISSRIFGINDVRLRWRFCRLIGTKGEMQFDLEQQAGSKVIGWMPSESQKGALLCWTEEPGVVTSVSEDRSALLFNAFKPIRSCLYHPDRAIIALSTDDELVVHSLRESRELLRIRRAQT